MVLNTTNTVTFKPSNRITASSLCPSEMVRTSQFLFPCPLFYWKREGGLFGHLVLERSLKGTSQCLAFWNRVVIKGGIVSASRCTGQQPPFLSLFHSSAHPQSSWGILFSAFLFLISLAENRNKMAEVRSVMAVLFMNYYGRVPHGESTRQIAAQLQQFDMQGTQSSPKK